MSKRRVLGESASHLFRLPATDNLSNEGDHPRFDANRIPMKTAKSHLQAHSFHAHAEDEIGMPNLAYELFYQQGLTCYRWALPRPYVLQALRTVVARYMQRFGAISFWQLRAFAYGLRGVDGAGQRKRSVPDEYRWPLPPDAAWQAVVCLYPDGLCDLDFVHPVSRLFWSEKNGFLELPSYEPRTLGGWWFEEMGFEIMRMQPAMQIQIADQPNTHLKLV